MSKNKGNISSIETIYQAIEEKNMKRRETFKIIINKCSSFIEKNVKFNHLSCFYQVPEFVIGRPLYVLEECISYIQQELENSGFLVKYFFPNVLYISWNPIELNIRSMYVPKIEYSTLGDDNVNNNVNNNAKNNVKNVKNVNNNVKNVKKNVKNVNNLSNYQKPSGKFVLNL